MGFTIMQTFMTKFSLQSGKGEGTTVRMEKNSATRRESMLDEKDTLALIARAKAGDNEAKEILLTNNASLLKKHFKALFE